MGNIGRYEEALEYILSFADYERASRSAVVFDTHRVTELLGRVGDPHKTAEPIHIAGTKGKGSTSAMVASVLTAAGYKTGLYTSPHLLTMRERIRIDGNMITEDEIADLVAQLKPEIEAVNRDGTWGELTTFEILTTLAFMYFHNQAVDCQVLEVGLGGRLDATNVTDSKVCAITSISYDHTETLGETLTQIATEKAGIIKPGAVVISAPQFPEASTVIEDICIQRKALLRQVGKDITWEKDILGPSEQSFLVHGLNTEYRLSIPLLGEHQLENATVAVGILEALVEKELRISPQSIATGLKQVKWEGRLQVLRTNPLFIIDGAHNTHSAQRLTEAISEYFEFERAIFIVGTSRDKDSAGIVEVLASFADVIISTQSRHPRATTSDSLATAFKAYATSPYYADTTKDAIGLALSMAGPRDLICATGSLFIVAEILEYTDDITSINRPT
ncbi:MAG: folylpolyglutamate synthase/dihydrofolate synthase family protein [Chloroflexota bacterium]|nr:folylpolyglutamate synthase/dihydrofolate synthase family protein [Chloroflexota bacterium]